MSEAEFLQWWAWYNREPFGDVRADVQAGIVAATIANVHRGRNSKAYQPGDFMPYQARAARDGNDIEAALNRFRMHYQNANAKR